MRLDAEGAHAAIARARSRKPLGLSRRSRRPTASSGIVNANMANAIRKASARRGVDPRAADAGRVRRQRPGARRHAGRGARHPPHPGAEAVAGLLGARAAAHRPRGRRDALVRHARRARRPRRASNALFAEMERGRARALAGRAPQRAGCASSAARRSATRARPSTCPCRSPARRAGDARATLARHGRALPPPARGAAHLREPRPGADPARRCG